MPCTVHSAPSSGVVRLPPFTRVASRLIRLIETRLRCLLYSNCVSIQMVPPCAVSACMAAARTSSAVTLQLLLRRRCSRNISRRSCPAETTWLTRHAIAGANHASMPVAASTSLLRADELVVRQRRGARSEAFRVFSWRIEAIPKSTSPRCENSVSRGPGLGAPPATQWHLRLNFHTTGWP